MLLDTCRKLGTGGGIHLNGKVHRSLVAARLDNKNGFLAGFYRLFFFKTSSETCSRAFPVVDIQAFALSRSAIRPGLGLNLCNERESCKVFRTTSHNATILNQKGRVFRHYGP